MGLTSHLSADYLYVASIAFTAGLIIGYMIATWRNGKPAKH